MRWVRELIIRLAGGRAALCADPGEAKTERWARECGSQPLNFGSSAVVTASGDTIWIYTTRTRIWHG